jgi:DNA-binding transcriptional ArsR family regulator
VCDLSWIAQRPQNLTSHHMKVLKGAGVVSARKEGKMTLYRLTPDGARLTDIAATVIDGHWPASQDSPSRSMIR